MARKKSIQEMGMEIDKIRKQLEEAQKNEAREKENLVLKVFYPAFTEEIFTFCDMNQKNKKLMEYIKETTTETMLLIMKKIKTKELVFEENTEKIEEISEEESKEEKE